MGLVRECRGREGKCAAVTPRHHAGAACQQGSHPAAMASAIRGVTGHRPGNPWRYVKSSFRKLLTTLRPSLATGAIDRRWIQHARPPEEDGLLRQDEAGGLGGPLPAPGHPAAAAAPANVGADLAPAAAVPPHRRLSHRGGHLRHSQHPRRIPSLAARHRPVRSNRPSHRRCMEAGRRRDGRLRVD